mmetsp:Transcript_41949/g.118951  ORF Transcript_41949/g.118951 Transcript_41949/m.118951 type:complete len:243 (+) Transcript_41949:2110-2838(+)
MRPDSTSLSLKAAPPLSLIHLPMSSCPLPLNCGRLGTGSLSPMSKKLIPYSSTATSSCSMASPLSMRCSCPMWLVPRHTSLTATPLLSSLFRPPPSRLCRIPSTRSGCSTAPTVCHLLAASCRPISSASHRSLPTSRGLSGCLGKGVMALGQWGGGGGNDEGYSERDVSAVFCCTNKGLRGLLREAGGVSGANADVRCGRLAFLSMAGALSWLCDESQPMPVMTQQHHKGHETDGRRECRQC